MLRRPPIPALLGRILRLSCPACGRGRLFRRFFLRLERCGGCRWKFERGEGHWIGGSEVHMFAAYGMSVLLSVPLLLVLEPTPLLQGALLGGHVALSLALFRYSRAAFLALDLYLDPALPPGRGDDRDGPAEPARPRTPPGALRRREPRSRGSRRGASLPTATARERG